MTQLKLGKVHHGFELHGKVVADAIYTGGPSSAKAGFRLVQALSGLEMNGTASQYARGLAERWPHISASLKRYARGRGSANEENAALESMWWEADAVVKTVTGQLCAPEGVKDSTCGDERFRAGDFAAAAKVYWDALEAVQNKHEVVRLLCNRAAAATHEANFLCAVVDATAALVLDAGRGKAWYRRALALCELGLFDKAAVACANGLRVLREQGVNVSDFKALERKICKHKTSAKANKTSTTEHKKRLQAEYEQLKALNAVCATFGVGGVADELGIKPPPTPGVPLGDETAFKMAQGR